MAEVKNAFIKSKMNKDLDARLIPQGEYRDAVNVQVSKSEGDDVGALENVLGNISIANFENNSGVPNLTCIGYFVNEFDNTLYLFFTDYTDPYSTPIPTYSPSANNFIYQCDLTNPISPTKRILVQGSFLNFSTNRPIIGVNVLEDFLFFTDNRNQPRKINISFALSNGVTYYTNEDNISVAKYYPYKPISLIKDSALSPGTDECSMYDAASQYIPLNNSSSPNISNPYYESAFPGDPQFLEDKFVRFSYRFKFLDGEYSLIAPFTQACFIPKQDGYFLAGDEKQTFASTIVDFMENKVNKIDLQIPLPSAGNQLLTNFHVSEIDIIYKESDGLALQVVETIPVSEITATSNVFEYSYLSQKPYKTLPNSEITRVYDKVPVKALGQEIISNRVVYSNFQDKHTPPNFIKYQVGANNKYSAVSPSFEDAKTTIEYPNHSLKQNRNYQVGFVLADRYGRQSTVILSNDEDPSSSGGFGADTVYLPYRSLNDSITFLGDSLKISVNEIIQSNKNDFNTPNQPGLYNGDSTNIDYNPLGWETYKIVVKQLEQDYYNVYTAGAMKGQPYWTNGNPPVTTPTNPLDQNATFITLLNDNINKVPRDLTEVGAQDKQFRSSVRLFGRVVNTGIEFSNVGNEQYFPGRKSFTVNQIEDLFDAFDVLQFKGGGNDVIPVTSTNSPYYAFFRSESNPFIAEFVTSQIPADQFGIVNAGYANINTVYERFENLNVLETAPVVSRLDLFYETSTVGDIATLNQNAGPSSGGGVAGVNPGFTYTHFESYASGTDVTNTFYFVDFANNKIDPASATLTSVTDNSGTGTNRYLEWTLVPLPNSEYKLQTNNTFYYTASPGDAGLQESYNFTFQVITNQGTSTIAGVSGILQNSSPSITNSNSTPIQALIGQQSILTGLAGLNGSADTTKNTDDLTFSIAGSTGNGVYSIVNNNEVQNSNTSAGGTGSFTVQVTDNGNPNALVATKTFDVIFDEPSSSTQQEYIAPQGLGIGDGSGVALFLTNSFSSYLTSDIPSNLGNTTTAYVRGLTDPSSATNPLTIEVCTGNTLPTPGLFTPNFFNFKSDNALSAGAFYVYINPYNSNPFTNIGDSQVNVRFAISYYDTSQAKWVTAVDMNGDLATTTATFRYAGSSIQGYNYNFSTYPSSSQGSITIQKDETITQPRYGGLVYAFDIPGEYRIIHGNFQSTFGAFNTSLAGCNNPNISFNMESVVEYGDFYYTVDEAGGTGKNIGPPAGESNTVYRYQISQGSCVSSWSGSNVYAREPLAKYVTQLYTNIAKTSLYPSVPGNNYRIKRMQNLGTGSGSAALNPEYTQDGSYTLQFSNTTGLVNPGTQTPCLY